MLQKVKEIILEHDLAVLATCFENKPHCSLMAYVPDSECRILRMLTLKDSRKYFNISRNPRVSLLIDTRNPETPREEFKALTISGMCVEASTKEQKSLKEMLIRKHAQLKGLAGREDSIVLEVSIESLQLLEGAEKARYFDLSGS